jgi:hypothetical protein
MGLTGIKWVEKDVFRLFEITWQRSSTVDVRKVDGYLFRDSDSTRGNSMGVQSAEMFTIVYRTKFHLICGEDTCIVFSLHANERQPICMGYNNNLIQCIGQHDWPF